jgi:hypothetical protein
VRCGRRAGWAGRASSRLPVLLVLAALLVQAGCTATVLPPAAVDEPARIAILDHGRHTSLVLEEPGGAVVLYAYGDWEWFALRRTGPREASAAVLGPSQAALGKKHLPGPLTVQTMLEQVRVLVTDIIILHVERRRLDDLAARLDVVFRANISSLVHNDAYDLDFVYHPEPYSVFHNSNEVVADWLEELGCRVTRPSLFFTWKLDAGFGNEHLPPERRGPLWQ